MIEIDPAQITPKVKSLFDPNDPAGLRCFAVLEGTAAGRIWIADSYNRRVQVFQYLPEAE